MTAPTLTELVEAVAEKHYLAVRAASDHPDLHPAWTDLPKFDQAVFRESVMPVVKATADVIVGALAAEFDEWATENDRQVEHYTGKAERATTETDLAIAEQRAGLCRERRDGYLDCARIARGVLA